MNPAARIVLGLVLAVPGVPIAFGGLLLAPEIAPDVGPFVFWGGLMMALFGFWLLTTDRWSQTATEPPGDDRAGS